MTAASGRGFAGPAGRAGKGGRLALVVFSGRTDLWWLRPLRPGFRHCLVILREAGGWIVYDPMAHGTDLAFLACAELSPGRLAAWLIQQGYIVAPARRRPFQPRPSPWVPFTCVEAVKRVLGIRARRVVTPWQLYRWLVGGGMFDA
ncbi:hypothetical protein [Ferruginivarius sediminum]|uniref:hypothetical protein n=1 Tax=Ferruginivarius sediminum TaxID=2661937 RepID=UPI001F4D7EC7|nr:hypothetical protein [Ferruginivarius sediminum]